MILESENNEDYRNLISKLSTMYIDKRNICS